MTTKYDKNVLFWNVDTQFDFMRKGMNPLYVPGAESIQTNLAEITHYARENNYRIINSADWHTLDDEEIDVKNPDFITTFPPHCMAGTYGAEFVPETRPINPYVIDDSLDYKLLEDSGEIVIHKNKFNVYSGNLITQNIIDYFKPKQIYVYGVAGNVCVDAVVQGHLKNNKTVTVLYDAVKFITPEGKNPEKFKREMYTKWQEDGVHLMSSHLFIFPGDGV